MQPTKDIIHLELTASLDTDEGFSTFFNFPRIMEICSNKLGNLVL
jgi:hypothetical protein